MPAYLRRGAGLRHCRRQQKPSPAWAGEGPEAELGSVGRPRAEIVALADRDPDMPDDVVSRRRVELHLQHCEMIEVVLRLQALRLAADGHGDLGVLLAVDLARIQAFQEIRGLVDARMDLGEAVVLIRQARQIDPGDPAGAKRVVAYLAYLALQRKHVR